MQSLNFQAVVFFIFAIFRPFFAKCFSNVTVISCKDSDFVIGKYTAALLSPFQCNFTVSNGPRCDSFAAIRTESEPVTFAVGGDTDGGSTLFAGAPRCGHGFVYELSDILRCIVVGNTQAAKLLFDMADLDG